MPEDGPEPNNPLGPYFPSEVPEIPGNGRKWVTILVAIAFVLWLLGQFVELLRALFS